MLLRNRSDTGSDVANYVAVSSRAAWAQRASGDEPAWIDSYHHDRLSVYAAEIFRDLKTTGQDLLRHGAILLHTFDTSDRDPCRPMKQIQPVACCSDRARVVTRQ
ncbi:hypothetical protein [Streptomyces celluloflavus]|uniref:hypothetical protein n=1 Tax=Streptomyces celluloflavus TaxID=58344 RepID=UPI00365A5763